MFKCTSLKTNFSSLLKSLEALNALNIIFAFSTGPHAVHYSYVQHWLWGLSGFIASGDSHHASV